MSTKPCPKCNGTGEVVDWVALGAKVREIREDSGVSLRKTAKLLRISAAHLSEHVRYANGTG